MESRDGRDPRGGRERWQLRQRQLGRAEPNRCRVRERSIGNPKPFRLPLKGVPHGRQVAAAEHVREIG